MDKGFSIKKFVRKNKDVWISLGVIAIYLLIMELMRQPTKCIFRGFTGVPCPGCGMTRSFASLLRGELDQAFYYHPLFWLVPFTIGLWMVYNYTQNKRLRRYIEWLAICFLITYVAVYVYRMSCYFPDHQPMKFYENGVVPSVFQKVKTGF